MQNQAYSITGWYTENDTGGAQFLALLRDGNIVSRFITSDIEVYIAAAHLLEFAANPEGLAAAWPPTLDDIGHALVLEARQHQRQILGR